MPGKPKQTATKIAALAIVKRAFVEGWDATRYDVLTELERMHEVGMTVRIEGRGRRKVRNSEVVGSGMMRLAVLMELVAEGELLLSEEGVLTLPTVDEEPGC